MRGYLTRLGVIAAALAVVMGSADPAAAQRIKAGLLTCDVSAGLGFIIGSSKSVSCLFSPDQPGPQLSPAKIPEEAPPRRVKNPCRVPARRSEVRISRVMSQIQAKEAK